MKVKINRSPATFPPCNEVPATKQGTRGRYDVTVWHLYGNQKALAMLNLKIKFPDLFPFRKVKCDVPVTYLEPDVL